MGGHGFEPAARGGAAAQLREVFERPQEYLLRNILGLAVIARQAGGR